MTEQHEQRLIEAEDQAERLADFVKLLLDGIYRPADFWVDNNCTNAEFALAQWNSYKNRYETKGGHPVAPSGQEGETT